MLPLPTEPDDFATNPAPTFFIAAFTAPPINATMCVALVTRIMATFTVGAAELHTIGLLSPARKAGFTEVDSLFFQ